MNLEERKNKARSTIVKVVFPGTTNHYDTLFGGTALQWMDEIAFITATRFSKKKVVTVSTHQIDFKNPIPEGSIVELIGEIKRVGKTSIVVQVSVYLEKMYEEYRSLALEGEFVMVAIDDEKNPISVVDA